MFEAADILWSGQVLLINNHNEIERCERDRWERRDASYIEVKHAYPILRFGRRQFAPLLTNQVYTIVTVD
jgi:hypothetical protein